jgi:hypothetical protein
MSLYYYTEVDNQYPVGASTELFQGPTLTSMNVEPDPLPTDVIVDGFSISSFINDEDKYVISLVAGNSAASCIVTQDLETWECVAGDLDPSTGDVREVIPQLKVSSTSKTFTLVWMDGYTRKWSGTVYTNLSFTNGQVWIGTESSSDVAQTPPPVSIPLSSSSPTLQMTYQTDGWGCNLSEVISILTPTPNDTFPYPKGYPKDLIGHCTDSGPGVPDKTSIFYSNKPNISSVLIGSEPFPSLLHHTNYLNSLYPSGYSDCDFFQNVMAYSSVRYVLAGILNHCFSDEWLRRGYTKKFMAQLSTSQFAPGAVEFFQQPQYDGLDSYFKC